MKKSTNVKAETQIDSYVKNCYLEGRIPDSSKPLFTRKVNGEYVASLDGYAIIPLERYYELMKTNKRAGGFMCDGVKTGENFSEKRVKNLK